MNDLQVFQFEGEKVRVIELEGEPWFVGKDVCEVLGFGDATTAIRSHCRGVQKLHPLQTAGGKQEVRIISEHDLYRLIMGSTLPSAEKFEAWVMEEVLPSIRKTGSYSAFKLPTTFAEALYLAADLETKRALLEAKIEKDAPKLESHAALMASEDSESITDAMKTFGIPPRKNVFPFLVEKHYLVGTGRKYDPYLPSQKALDEKLMIKRETVYGNGKVRGQARVMKSQLDNWRKIIPRMEKWMEEHPSK